MAVRRWNPTTSVVNTQAVGYQIDPVVKALPDGGYVVAWQDGVGEVGLIRMQRYDASGAPVGGEVLVEPDSGSSDPDIAVLADGTFVVVYADRFGSNENDHDISAVRYDADGNVVGFVSSGIVSTSANHQFPSVAATGDGGFVMVQSEGTDGAHEVVLYFVDPILNEGSKIVVNNLVSTGDQTEPEVAVLSNGNVAVVWRNQNEDLRVRVFDSAGSPLGSEAIANTNAVNPMLSSPDILALANGGFIITWRDDTNAFPGDMWDLRGRVFSPTGVAIGSDYILNSGVKGLQSNQAMAALPGGGFVMVWIDHEGLASVEGQLFDDLGQRVGSQFTVTNEIVTSVGDDNSYLSVAALSDGRFVVTWVGLDDDVAGIRSQIFDPRDGVIEGGEGDEVMYGHDQVADQMSGEQGNDQLFGLGGDDWLYGGAGHDLLDGGAGADLMEGGTGDDTYHVDHAGDVVREVKNEGVDTVVSSISFNLAGQHIDNLTLTGNADIDGLGNSLANVMTGNAGANRLEGLGGHDTLDGGGGADTLIGGAGNDTYYVDHAGDVVVEVSGQGADLVYSSVSFSLDGQHVEDLTLTGAANIDGTGNSLANVLTGNGGHNTLDGAGGADRMYGGLGNDIYYVDSAGDQVFEVSNQGRDTVRSTVSFSLAGQHVENLTLLGSGDLNGTGNSLANQLTGTNGQNVLDGGTGNDRLVGRGGADEFVFRTNAGRDEIADFQVNVDHIRFIGVAGVDDFSDLDITTNGDGWAVVSYGAGTETITLTGVTAAQLDAGDFAFGPSGAPPEPTTPAPPPTLPFVATEWVMADARTTWTAWGDPFGFGGGLWSWVAIKPMEDWAY